jgi:hypothetical protein
LVSDEMACMTGANVGSQVSIAAIAAAVSCQFVLNGAASPVRRALGSLMRGGPLSLRKKPIGTDRQWR